MSKPQFGYCLPIFANPSAGLFRTPAYAQLDARTTLDLGVHAEMLGFDSLWVADHLMLGKDEAILEGWTTVSALAGATKSAKLGVIHQSNYFRSPGMSAKMIATIDALSDGRFILFFDFGRQMREHRSYDLPYPDDVDLRAQECVAGLELMMDLWESDGPISAERGPYRVTDATCTPKPVQLPHPPIWFGEMEPDLIDALARIGNGWNTTPVSLTELDRRLAVIRSACEKHNRPFDEIEISVEMQVMIASDGNIRPQVRDMLALVPNPESVDPQLRAFAEGTAESPPESFSDITIYGSPDQVAAGLQAYIDHGTDHFLLWFLGAPDPNDMELFASEVVPRFR
jgi:alkanesulfonate monooxygenase SsuD/methylene tetrahydromethanopterin reductase-like flavin-dependent oxidoreductase (luciferase family)